MLRVVLNAWVTKTTAAQILANPATRRRQVTMTISLNPLRSSRGKPARFPGRQKFSQFRSVSEACRGLRTEFRPFSRARAPSNFAAAIARRKTSVFRRSMRATPSSEGRTGPQPRRPFLACSLNGKCVNVAAHEGEGADLRVDHTGCRRRSVVGGSGPWPRSIGLRAARRASRAGL